jgi:predicted enzyme related to lactoylglutathione lyase
MHLSIPRGPCVVQVDSPCGMDRYGRDARKGAAMANPVVHFEILGPDATALQQFYGGLFDWKIDASNPMNYGLVSTGEGQTTGGITAGENGQTGVAVYISVDDLQATLDRIEKAGGKTVVPPTEIPNMVTFAQFSDPAGNVVGLVKS